MDEKEYRKLVAQTFDEIARAFDAIDPDLAEFENAHGAVTIEFADGSRCILSTQPSVRQIWLADASRGTAVHFNFEPSRKAWLDDKGQGIELKSCIKGVVKSAAKLELEF